MRKILIVLAGLSVMLCSCVQKGTEFTVLQWNIWQEGTMVPGGYDAIVDEIERLRPDFVTFSEVRNYHGIRFCDRIVASLRERGLEYYSFYSYDSGLLSRYPITDSTTVFPENGDHGSIYRMVSEIDGREIAVYTAHLDYLNDAYYNVRGYDGSTWEKIPIPQTVLEVLQVNDASQRDDAIRDFIAAARKDIEAGRIVIPRRGLQRALAPGLDPGDQGPVRPQRAHHSLDSAPDAGQCRICRHLPGTVPRRIVPSWIYLPGRQSPDTSRAPYLDPRCR